MRKRLFQKKNKGAVFILEVASVLLLCAFMMVFSVWEMQRYTQLTEMGSNFFSCLTYDMRWGGYGNKYGTLNNMKNPNTVYANTGSIGNATYSTNPNGVSAHLEYPTSIDSLICQFVPDYTPTGRVSVDISVSNEYFRQMWNYGR